MAISKAFTQFHSFGVSILSEGNEYTFVQPVTLRMKLTKKNVNLTTFNFLILSRSFINFVKRISE